MIKLFTKSKQSNNVVSPCLIPPIKIVIANQNCTISNKAYLNYQKGDYLHIISEIKERGEWYQACNPITNTIGLVNMNNFDEINKQVTMDTVDYHLDCIAFVLFDFRSESYDELTVKQGDQLIILAESNKEWLVVQLIHKVKSSSKMMVKGLPGLVPCSYLKFYNVHTHKYIPNSKWEQYQQKNLIKIPSVKEWKNSYFQAQRHEKKYSIGSECSSNYSSGVTTPKDHRSLSNNVFGSPQSSKFISISSPTSPNLQTTHNQSYVNFSGSQKLVISNPSLSSSFYNSVYVPSTCQSQIEKRVLGIEYNLKNSKKYHFKVQIGLEVIYKVFEDFIELNSALLPYCQFHLPNPEDYIDWNMCEKRMPILNDFLDTILRLKQEKAIQIINQFRSSKKVAVLGGQYIKVKLIMKNEIIALKLNQNFNHYDLYMKICSRFNKVQSLYYIPNQNKLEGKFDKMPLNFDVSMSELIDPITGKIVIYAD